jgi:hypothetical protein
MKVIKFRKAPLAAGISLALGLPFSGGFVVADEANVVEEQFKEIS